MQRKDSKREKEIKSTERTNWRTFGNFNFNVLFSLTPFKCVNLFQCIPNRNKIIFFHKSAYSHNFFFKFSVLELQWFVCNRSIIILVNFFSGKIHKKLWDLIWKVVHTNAIFPFFRYLYSHSTYRFHLNSLTKREGKNVYFWTLICCRTK